MVTPPSCWLILLYTVLANFQYKKTVNSPVGLTVGVPSKLHADFTEHFFYRIIPAEYSADGNQNAVFPVFLRPERIKQHGILRMNSFTVMSVSPSVFICYH
jgi:hypothetical protein